MSRRDLQIVSGVLALVAGMVAAVALERGKGDPSIPTKAAIESISPDHSTAGSDAALASAEQSRFPAEMMPTVLKRREIHKLTTNPNWRESFCDERSWSSLPFEVSIGSEGEFFVDVNEWEHTGSSTRAGLASWISECQGGGQAIRILATGAGTLLAEYDSSSGLRMAVHRP
jgi:hypothetical protein